MTKTTASAGDGARSRRVDLAKQGRRATFRAQSFDADANTIEVVWTTGATVRRFDGFDEYDEALSLKPGAVRLDRLNAGAPFLDTHDSTGLASVIGSVVRGSASIEGGKGTATVLLSRAKDVADTVQKIKEGTIRNISVGYWVYACTEEGQDGGVPLRTATDWEPLELSAVPIPADAGSQIRSAPGQRTAPCRVTKVDRAADRARADAILSTGKRSGFPNLARKHARLGTSVARFTDILLGRLARRQRVANAARKANAMSQEERDYSRGAAAARKAKAGGTDTPEQKDERRVDAQIADLAGKAAGERHFRKLAEKTGYVGARTRT